MNNEREKGFNRMFVKYFFSAAIFFLSGAGVVKSGASVNFQNVNSSEFYAALKSQDTIKINLYLKAFVDDSSTASCAYRGALLMKKSELKKSKREKIILFKQGRLLLEGVIKKENQNAEFRFLRLIIQENCPAFLRYHDNIKDDADKVKQFYKNFSPQLKREVAEYSRVSKTLKSGDFEN